MKFTDMKSTDNDRDAPSVLGGAGEDYYPLSLYLDKEMIGKLDLAGCKIGDEKTLVIKTRVTSLSESESESGEDYSSMSLTIREAAVHGAEKGDADTLYGDD